MKASALILAFLTYTLTADADVDPLSEKANGRPLVLQDDFQTDTRGQYDIFGDVDWKKGHVTVHEGASFGHVATGGSAADVQVDLGVPSTKGASEVRLELSFERASNCSVVWSRPVGQDDAGHVIRVVDTVPQEGAPPRDVVVRAWTFDEPIDGSWVVSYQFGLLTIQRQPAQGDALSIERLAFIENGPASINGVRLFANRGAFRVSRIVVHADPRRSIEVDQRNLLSEAADLDRQVELLFRRGQWREALTRAQRVSTLRKDVLGTHHPDYASSLNNLGMLYMTLGKYSLAEPLHKQAAEITDVTLGKRHPNYAVCLGNLARLYKSIGQHSRADSYYVEVLKIQKRALGDEHLHYVTTSNNLAMLYQSTGEYVKAERLFRHNHDVVKKAFGESHPAYISCLGNLVLPYASMRDFAKAEPLLQKAVKLSKDVLGEGHPHYAARLSNLAGIYQLMGAHSKAIAVYSNAREIESKSVGRQHPNYATTLQNLALLYQSTGQYELAKPLYLEASEIEKQRSKGRNRSYARSQKNLGTLYRLVGDYEQSAKLLAEAREITSSISGGELHPTHISVLKDTAFLRHLRGSHAEAESLFREVVDANLRRMDVTLPWISEAQSHALLGRPLGEDQWLSVARELSDVTPAEAWSIVWQTRGLLLSVLHERQLATTGSPEARQIVSRLQRVQRQMSQLALSAPNADQRRQRLTDLSNEKEKLEQELAIVSEPYRRTRAARSILPKDLFESVPAGTAIVQIAEVTLHQPIGSESGGFRRERHYEAFVASASERDIAWLHLGPARPIDDTWSRWRRQLINADKADAARSPHSGDVPPAVALRKRLWEPIEAHIGKADHIVLIPDGDLSVFPWAALPGRSPESYLLEDYAVSTVTHGRQLHRLLMADTEASDALLLAGGIDYDHRGTTKPSSNSEVLVAANRRSARPAILSERPHWGQLKGTDAEVQSILKQWKQGPAVTLTKTAANEDALRKHVSNAGYVHLATHGFFADRRFRMPVSHQRGDPVTGSATAGGQVTETITARNPLILSGIVLAGANLPPEVDEVGLETGDDGILTAEEVVNLDLSHARLVTLSACESGLGEIGGGGEGVFGLQRAFHLAGARAVVSSLWKVDDHATQSLMVEFYTNLWHKKMSKLEALRQAQLTLLAYYEPKNRQLARGPGGRRPVDAEALKAARKRRDDERLDPFFWAAWTLSGDWR